MTYKLISKSEKEFEFKRETSSFADMTFVVGGFLIVFFASLIPAEVLGITFKVILFVFGAGFWGAAFYMPYIKQRYTPESTSFNLEDQRIAFVMADGTYTYLPFDQVEGFEIDIEKRSPSEANSAGIHYMHYHINLKRINSGTWTITSTTDKDEADQMISFLKRSITKKNSSHKIDVMHLPSKVSAQLGELTELRWQAGRYGLIISNSLLYVECKSNGSVETKKEFDLTQFVGVTYSYSGAIQNKNHSLLILFNQPDSNPVKLNLFLRDLNPVECLQFEQWLSQTIHERKI